MSLVNPYAPPPLPAKLADAEWPTHGVFRDRGFVVKHAETLLPRMCVKTGEPTPHFKLLYLSCDGPNDGSISYAGRYLGDKSYAIFAPIADDAALAWRPGRVFGVACTVAGGIVLAVAAILVVAGSYRAVGPSYYTLGVVSAGAGAAVCAIGYYTCDVTSRRLKLVRIRRGFYWLRGACPQFLESLPMWPE
jgi:hypothetical protein